MAAPAAFACAGAAPQRRESTLVKLPGGRVAGALHGRALQRARTALSCVALGVMLSEAVRPAAFGPQFSVTSTGASVRFRRAHDTGAST